MQHLARKAVVWLGLLILPLPLILLLDTQLVDTPSHLLAYDFGIAAYVWWLGAICLATRPRWLERWIGLPSIYFIHGVVGVFAIIAATLHKFLSFSMFPLVKDTGNIAWYLEIFLIIYAVLFLSGWLIDRVHSLRVFKNFLERHAFRHKLTIWVHRLNWLVVALIWLHVQLIARLNIPSFRVSFDLYTALAVLVYIWWKFQLSFKSAAGVVVKNVALADDLQKITIRLTCQHYYHAGDFYFVSFLGKGNVPHETHPFSVSSVPRQSPTELTFTIQRRGDDTRKVSQIPVGTAVKLEGPFGRFDREIQQSPGPVILYGLGTGGAPLLSLAGQYAGSKEIHLIWSGQQADNHYYHKELQQLTAQGVKIDTQLHRFTMNELKEIVSAHELNAGRVIVVGSAPKVLAVEKTLRELGFNRRQLSDERVTL